MILRKLESAEYNLCWPAMDNGIILFAFLVQRCWKVRGTRTYTAVAITENTYLGMTTEGGMKVWKHMPKEYIVGALFPVTLKLMNTIKTFPNLPTGWSMASTSPPTLPPAYPASQAGTTGATVAAAAPRH